MSILYAFAFTCIFFSKSEQYGFQNSNWHQGGAFGGIVFPGFNNQNLPNQAQSNQNQNQKAPNPFPPTGKKVLMMIANGSETVEIVSPADTLRRMGIEVTIASIDGRQPVRTVEGIYVTPDIALWEVKDKDAYDAVIMPGGLGWPGLSRSQLVGEILRNQYNKGKIVASICMAATAFLAHGIGYGKKITTFAYPELMEYPDAIQRLSEKYQYVEDPVVQDGNLISSRGPATVYHYTFKIAENLVEIEKVRTMSRLNLFTDLYP